MTRQTCILSSIAFATVLAVATLAQDNPPPPPPANMDITGIPASRGIYYRANEEWVSLSHTVLMPFWAGRSTAL
jgi:hypothetical protein